MEREINLNYRNPGCYLWENEKYNNIWFNTDKMENNTDSIAKNICLDKLDNSNKNEYYNEEQYEKVLNLLKIILYQLKNIIQ